MQTYRPEHCPGDGLFILIHSPSLPLSLTRSLLSGLLKTAVLLYVSFLHPESILPRPGSTGMQRKQGVFSVAQRRKKH